MFKNLKFSQHKTLLSSLIQLSCSNLPCIICFINWMSVCFRFSSLSDCTNIIVLYQSHAFRQHYESLLERKVLFFVRLSKHVETSFCYACLSENCCSFLWPVFLGLLDSLSVWRACITTNITNPCTNIISTKLTCILTYINYKTSH